MKFYFSLTVLHINIVLFEQKYFLNSSNTSDIVVENLRASLFQ